MKKYAVTLAAIVLILLVSLSPLRAYGQEERKSLGILPFTIHSSEDIEYVRSGIWDMLISRLSAAGEIDVVDKQAIVGALTARGVTELEVSDAYEIGRNLSLDYVLWGSITKIGSSISLDGRLLDVATQTAPVGVSEQTRGMDDVIPKIGDLSRRVHAHILGRDLPAAAPPAPVVSRQVQQQPQERTPGAGEPVDVLRSHQGTLTAIINPSYIMSPDVLDREGFFMSPRYPKKFKGMDIGDVDGDGKNEVVVIDRNTVMIYQLRDEGFVLKHSITGSSADNHIAVDVADINGNGTPEIIVTSMMRTRLNSFIIEYRDGAYETIAAGLPWFFRVIESSNGPQLLGQQLGMDHPFEKPIYQVIWDNGSYRQGRRMSIPEGLAVYGMTMASLDGGRTERVIALDTYDRLNVYQKTTKPLSKIHVFGGSSDLVWKSNEAFGGSDNLIDFELRRSGVAGSEKLGEEENVYANVRILTYDLKGDGKNEIIIIKNESTTERLLRNVKIFNRSEIYGFSWDGLGLLENWKTRSIQGYVTDYQFKDLNNDGRNQIVLALVLPTRQSVVVAYDLILHDGRSD
ncbi:MAG: FG-GAP-like repeat-containing protein [Syntrophales bacterium]|jgi:TolB-like protein|nr:FG-GAP-like repeat-containing protein [Syntrophales bacterium]MCK9527436.1 FG-GAP-like repeat-containing protein [Syntrophales bacterium]MDX9921540.1 FG-GAP-like repeat-containing protein [Syntrophales bacterium]